MSKQTSAPVWQWRTGQLHKKKDVVVTEEPLTLELQTGRGRQTLAITMRTPGNDYELAAGFLFGEGVIQHKEEITTMTYCVGEERENQAYNLLTIRLRREELPNLPHLERHFVTNSACGVCGSTMLEQLATRPVAPLPAGPFLPGALLLTLPEKMRQAQKLFAQTGGVHAAGLFSAGGELLEVREDVGRHNALDKLIGWGVLNNQLPFHDKVVLVSGRASYELLQKCYAAGVPMLCSVSAPSSLAVSLARQFGLTLVGFLRGHGFNVYTRPERII